MADQTYFLIVIHDGDGDVLGVVPVGDTSFAVADTALEEARRWLGKLRLHTGGDVSLLEQVAIALTEEIRKRRGVVLTSGHGTPREEVG